MSFISWMAQARSSRNACRGSRGDPVVGPVVEDVEDELADQVVRDRPALQAVLGEEGVPPFAILVVVEGLLDVEVVAPAGELDAVVAPLAGLLADRFQGQVGPLAGEQGDGSGHGACVSPQIRVDIRRRGLDREGESRNLRSATAGGNVNDLTGERDHSRATLGAFPTRPGETTRRCPSESRPVRLRWRDRRHRERPHRRLAADLAA